MINIFFFCVDFVIAEELKRRLDENTELQDEIAKLKVDLDECKSQLVVAILRLENDIEDEKRKAREEIDSMQQVILDTLKESSLSREQWENELRRLKNNIMKLEQENSLIKSQIAKDQPQEGPQISLSTVTKTLARKVASQLGADALSLGSDNLEESMRKVKKYVRKLATARSSYFLIFSTLNSSFRFYMQFFFFFFFFFFPLHPIRSREYTHYTDFERCEQ